MRLTLTRTGYLTGRLTPSSFSHAVRQQLAQIPGVTWRPAEKAYHGPYTLLKDKAQLLEESGVAKFEEKSGYTPPVLFKDLRNNLSAPDYLYPYQKAGVEQLSWILTVNHRALLADEPGLGKTLQALHTAKTLHLEPTVIAPAAVAQVWENEARKYQLPLREVLSYASLGKRKHPIEFLVLDEGHYISNPKAQRTKKVLELITETPEKEEKKKKEEKPENLPPVLILTGTPITSRVMQFHSLLTILDSTIPPDSWWKFSKRYADGHYEEIPTGARIWKADGASNLDELQKRIAPYTVRRTKEELRDQLPAKIHQTIEVPTKLKDRKVPPELQDHPGNKQFVRRLLESIEEKKVKFATTYIQDLVAQGARPLVFTLKRETAKQLALALGCPYVTGATPPEKRENILRELSLGVATVWSVTTGLTLVNYNTVVFCGIPWTPHTILQAQDRIHRPGQKDVAHIHYLIAKGTIEEKIRTTVLDRLDIQSRILLQSGSEQGLQASLDLGDPVDMILSALGIKKEEGT